MPTKPKCYKCARLVEKEFPGGLSGHIENRAYRCSVGAFDHNNGTLQYFSWGGIVKPNKMVAACQAGCTAFIPGNPRR